MLARTRWAQLFLLHASPVVVEDWLPDTAWPCLGVEKSRVHVRLQERPGERSLPGEVSSEQPALTNDSSVSFSVQGMDLMSGSEMHKQVSRTWNPGSEIPLRNWMNDTQNAEDRARLKCVGNIVFPKAAQMALHIIAREVMGS